jgi:transposase-like protein
MTKAEQARLLAWRLKIFQHAGEGSRRVSHTCRHFGISRKTFYKWKKRYEADGPTGLCDRHCRPHRSPRAFSHEVVSKVLYLRAAQSGSAVLSPWERRNEAERAAVAKDYARAFVES